MSTLRLVTTSTATSAPPTARLASRASRPLGYGPRCWKGVASPAAQLGCSLAPPASARRASRAARSATVPERAASPAGEAPTFTGGRAYKSAPKGGLLTTTAARDAPPLASAALRLLPPTCAPLAHPARISRSYPRAGAPPSAPTAHRATRRSACVALSLRHRLLHCEG